MKGTTSSWGRRKRKHRHGYRRLAFQRPPLPGEAFSFHAGPESFSESR
jgi:hypothetical protein